MIIADKIAMYAAIFAAISALASFAACIITVHQARPQLKYKFKEEECIFAAELEKQFALISFEIQNLSAVPGMVSDIFIYYNGNKYHGENSSSMYDVAPLKFSIIDKLQGYQKDFEKSKYKLPIVINGFSVVSGFILVPNFPSIDVESAMLSIGIHSVDKKFDIIFPFCFIKCQGVDGNKMSDDNNQTTNTR